MNLWQLDIFRRVIETKSFSKTAEIIHLSQPTVSSHIKELEEHFECRLIDRLPREAVPTKAGELLYTYAQKLLFLRDAAEMAMAAFHGKTKGRLSVGGSTIPGGYILPKLIGDFTRCYPEVRIALLIKDTEQVIQDILCGNVEFGIVGAKSEDDRIDQKKLLEDKMKLIVPGTHRWCRKQHIDIKELFAEPFIVREPGSGTLKAIKASFNKSGWQIEDLNIVAEMGNTQAVLQGIKSGVGVSILSILAAREELAAKTLYAIGIKGVTFRRSFYLSSHKLRTPSPLSKAFTAFLGTHIQHV